MPITALTVMVPAGSNRTTGLVVTVAPVVSLGSANGFEANVTGEYVEYANPLASTVPPKVGRAQIAA
jgi:hypothetical protein